MTEAERIAHLAAEWVRIPGDRVGPWLKTMKACGYEVVPVAEKSVAPPTERSSSMIVPTVGGVVWFYPNIKESMALAVYGAQPMAATVAYVYNERLVNLSVVDHAGQQHVAKAVPLLQDDDNAPAEEHYCTWMPYQVGQAQKTEQLERSLGKHEYDTGSSTSISTGTDRAGYAPRENAQGRGGEDPGKDGTGVA